MWLHNSVSYGVPNTFFSEEERLFPQERKQIQSKSPLIPLEDGQLQLGLVTADSLT